MGEPIKEGSACPVEHCSTMLSKTVLETGETASGPGRRSRRAEDVRKSRDPKPETLNVVNPG